ncbi:MAG TPA: Dam family site-specific DNA-(adenine-N6)-methyltransferase [Candidatus Polarisedimenticolia bacterium]|nr:Dam family site-specific DNA-(adenine-N6)-methyltransferase [Candidatus Polarisedimenticolia bacterium]
MRAQAGRARRRQDLVAAPAGAVRPPLKWAGGKRWQLSELAPLWRPHADRRLVEPFCGGLAVAMGLAPRRALLNDINPHLVNFYRWLKKGLAVGLPMRNSETLYYRHRAQFNRLLAGGAAGRADCAALFYYLNRTCYNGLCRFNGSGLFNVPFGRYARINYVRDFAAYKETFRHWEFTCRDFEALEIDDGDFVYADPPYDVPFTQYSRGGFGWDDQVRAAQRLARHRGPVVLSNQATDRIVSLYAKLGFRLRYLSAPRNISCTGDRTRAREVLALRNLD